MRFLISLCFAAPLFAQATCTYVVDPLVFNIGATTSTGTVHVTQTPGSVCDPYNATTQTPWLHITSGVSGTPGDAGVAFTVDQNPAATPRSGVLSIALQQVIVNQAGATCSFVLTPTSRNFQVSGGTDTFTVQTTCLWQAASNVGWITLSSNRTSNSPVSYSVAANACVAGRSGAITLQQTNLAPPPTLAITQDGSPGNLSLSAYSATVSSAASDGRVTVTTGDGCNWSATTTESWIRITAGAAGAGNGAVTYHVLENTIAQRTGSIHVGPLTYTITQLAPAPAAVVLKTVGSAANYNTEAVAPGEIVSLFGDNMGPPSIATLQVSNGVVTSSLAGTQVLFDGVAAPMIFTLKGQASAVVPYGVDGKTSTQVQVRYLDPVSNTAVVSNTLTVPVQSAHPGIFSVDSTGVGPGAILNQDLTLNSSGNPAARGSVIAIYCTGGGVTTPASGDGEVIGLPLRWLVQKPLVTLGGVKAAVNYYGAVPTTVAGLVQINVEVPAGVTPSLAVPVIVKIGEFSTTGSVTVAVR